jgi:hypothetical protein
MNRVVTNIFFIRKPLRPKFLRGCVLESGTGTDRYTLERRSSSRFASIPADDSGALVAAPTEVSCWDEFEFARKLLKGWRSSAT